MAKIEKTQNIVLEILQENEEARKDDYILILEVFKRFVSPRTQIKTICCKHTQLGLPSVHTIIRVRRKLQELHPHLRDEETTKIRKEEEQKYKQYALNV